MEQFETENFGTEVHSEELDFIFNRDIKSIDKQIFQKRDGLRNLIAFSRLFKKKYRLKESSRVSKDFTNIVYLTLDCPCYTPNSSKTVSAVEYIKEFRKQYPNNDIRLLIPIIGVSQEEFKSTKQIKFYYKDKEKYLEKTSVHFEFFMQNRVHRAVLYKFPKTDTNIEVYGIFSPIFSYLDAPDKLYRFHYLAPFMKSARIAIKKLTSLRFKVDIVHSDNLPFLLGEEINKKHNYGIKFIQSITDFLQIEDMKTEAFWTAINLADKKEMKRICSDNEIKKGIALLFNLHNSKKFSQIKDCLSFVYKNYYKFRKYIDKGEDVEENMIFNKLNKRIVKLFPKLECQNDLYFNPYLYSLKCANKWITVTKTYYEDIFKDTKLTGSLSELVAKTQNKSDYVSFGFNEENYLSKKLYSSFTLEDFREKRNLNKTALLKEFSSEKINSNQIDSTLFRDENYKIAGFLDSFYSAPLIFANPQSDIFANGIDIIFNTVLKLFELHKNVQVIICIKNGLRHNFIKSWIEFLNQNKYLNGRCVFIDGDINPEKFYAASDMTLIPRRSNLITTEHINAMRYGCIPIVSKNGILNDTISDIFDDINLGCGFKTKTGLMTEEDNNVLFMAPLTKALGIYQNNPASWNLLVKNCLNNKSDWDFETLEKYNQIYESL